MANPNDPTFLKSHKESFAFALSGWNVLLRTQRNFRIHVAMGSMALGLAFFLQVSRTELSVILLTIVTVLAAEALNTAIEMTVDMFSAKRSWPAKWAKDIAASAVLITSIGAMMIGLLILGPPLYERLLELI